MTTCFTGKSFVWSTQKQEQQNQLGKTATILTKGYSKFMGTQEWLKCRLLFGLNEGGADVTYGRSSRC